MFNSIYPVPGTVSYGQVTPPAHSAPAGRCWDSQTTHPGLTELNCETSYDKICTEFCGHQKARNCRNCLAEAFTPASLVCHPITCHPDSTTHGKITGEWQPTLGLHESISLYIYIHMGVVKTHVHIGRCHSNTKSLAWALERLPDR
jgi:hypothetical protein